VGNVKACSGKRGEKVTTPHSSPGTSAYPDLNDAAHQRPDIVERLRTIEELTRAWHSFELGQDPPARLNLMKVAHELTAAADEIERLRAGVAQCPACDDVIEQCAKIADPWPGFNVGQKISEPDLSVIEVRTKIAGAIRALCSDSSTLRCQHAAIISLDGKWHCQKCGDAIEVSAAQVPVTSRVQR
jgi:ribosomal protein L37AE/L43A